MPKITHSQTEELILEILIFYTISFTTIGQGFFDYKCFQVSTLFPSLLSFFSPVLSFLRLSICVWVARNMPVLTGKSPYNTWVCIFESLPRIFFFFFCFLGPHPRHVEVPRPGVKSELQLLAYDTATAMQDPSLVCDLHQSSQQCQIPNH